MTEPQSQLRIGLGLWAALLGVAGCATVPRPEPAESGWVEVHTRHLNIRAQLDEGAAIEVARSMEAVRSGLTAFFQTDLDEDRLDAVLFRDHASLSDFAPFAVRGFLVETHSGPWLVTSLTAFRDSSFQIVEAHELAHHLSAYVMLRQPRWLSEGLASWLETLELDRAHHRVVFGKPPSWIRPEDLATRPVTTAALWQWQGPEIPPQEAYGHVAQSWWLVHHLLEKRPAQFADFRRLLKTGADPRAAWNQAFIGLTDAALDAELLSSLPHLTDQRSALPLKLEPVEPTVSPLPAAEVHAIQAVLQAHSSEPLERSRAIQKIEQQLNAALGLDPQNERALLLTAWLVIDDRQRIAFLRRVVGQLPYSGKALGALALNLALKGEDPRAMLQHAHALEPTDPNILDRLAWYSAVYGEPTRAVALAEEAVSRRPWSPDFVSTLALALGAAGRCPEAAERQAQALDLLGHSTLDRRALESQLALYAQGCSPEQPIRPRR